MQTLIDSNVILQIVDSREILPISYKCMADASLSPCPKVDMCARQNIQGSLGFVLKHFWQDLYAAVQAPKVKRLRHPIPCKEV